MANERCQQNSHKWQTSVDSWASGDIGEVLSLFYESLDCFTMRLFHSATIFCCYICTCICCLKLHQADYQVGDRPKDSLWARLERVFFSPFFFNSIWWGTLSSNVFTICAVYWSLGRRGYFGISNGILVLILMLFWLSETGKIWGFQAFWSCSVDFPHYGDPLAEIGHIWGFWALSGEPVGVNVEGRAEAYFRRFASSAV